MPSLEKLKQEIKEKIEDAEKVITEGCDDSGFFECEEAAQAYADALKWVLGEIEK